MTALSTDNSISEENTTTFLAQNVDYQWIYKRNYEPLAALFTLISFTLSVQSTGTHAEVQGPIAKLVLAGGVVFKGGYCS